MKTPQTIILSLKNNTDNVDFKGFWSRAGYLSWVCWNSLSKCQATSQTTDSNWYYKMVDQSWISGTIGLCAACAMRKHFCSIQLHGRSIVFPTGSTTELSYTWRWINIHDFATFSNFCNPKHLLNAWMISSLKVIYYFPNGLTSSKCLHHQRAPQHLSKELILDWS